MHPTATFLALDQSDLRGVRGAHCFAFVSGVVIAASDHQAAAPNPANHAKEEEHKRTLDLYRFVMTETGDDFGQVDPQWFDYALKNSTPIRPQSSWLEFCNTGQRNRAASACRLSIYSRLTQETKS